MAMVWISKYAQTQGITQHEVEIHNDVAYKGKDFRGFLMGRDAHLSYADAVKAAHAARLKKIASLKKQITKLQTLAF